MADLLDKIPPSVRSLWKSEIELRRGLWSSIFRRPEEARQHYSEAKRLFSEGMASLRQPSQVPGEKKWGSYDHTEKTLEQREQERRAAEPPAQDPPRF